MTKHSICALAGGLLLCAMASCGIARAQSTVRFSATNGDTVLAAAGTTFTLQQPATNGTDVFLEQAVVYCSVACSVTMASNGAAATTTAGTITPILPAPANASITAKVFTASNVGAGTAIGGILHLPPGGTTVICLAKSCGNNADVVLAASGGATSNFSVTISSITGTTNTTIYGRIVQ